MEEMRLGEADTKRVSLCGSAQGEGGLGVDRIAGRDTIACRVFLRVVFLSYVLLCQHGAYPKQQSSR